jgi:hypothetical protein
MATCSSKTSITVHKITRCYKQKATVSARVWNTFPCGTFPCTRKSLVRASWNAGPEYVRTEAQNTLEQRPRIPKRRDPEYVRAMAQNTLEERPRIR